MSYTKTIWVDDTSPAINANNLNKIEEGIFDVDGRTSVIETTITNFVTDVDITSEINNAIDDAVGDLSGVTDAATARTNLDVYSKDETDAVIISATPPKFDFEIKTSNFDVVSTGQYIIEVTNADITGTLPSSPTDNDWCSFKVYTVDGYKFIVGANGENIEGDGSDMDIEDNYISFTLVFNSTKGWMLV